MPNIFLSLKNRFILITLLFLFLLIIGIITYSYFYSLVSDKLFSEANTKEELKNVILKYPKSRAASYSLLLLAKLSRDNGQLNESDMYYTTYMNYFFDSDLSISCMLGKASNALMRNNINSAFLLYQQAFNVFPNSYGTPFAIISDILLATDLGKEEEKKNMIQLLQTHYPNSIVTQIMKSSLMTPLQ